MTNLIQKYSKEIVEMTLQSKASAEQASKELSDLQKQMEELEKKYADVKFDILCAHAELQKAKETLEDQKKIQQDLGILLEKYPQKIEKILIGATGNLEDGEANVQKCQQQINAYVIIAERLEREMDTLKVSLDKAKATVTKETEYYEILKKFF